MEAGGDVDARIRRALMKRLALRGRLIVAANWPRTAPAAATCPPPD